MRSFYRHSIQVAASYLSIALIATGTLGAGQMSPPAASVQTNDGQSSAGWKRVGEMQTPDQGGNYPQDPSVGNGNNQGPPTTQAPDASQAGAPNQPTPSYSNQGPVQQPSYQPGYGQAPYSQPNYSQPPANYQPQAPVPPQLTVPAGTFVTVRVNQLLSSDHNQAGDAFSATLVQPLVVNGVVIAEPGQTIAGRVVEAQMAGRIEGTARLRVQLTELTLVDGQQIPVQTQLISRRALSSAGRDAAAIAGTTGFGAALGAAAGWGTGAAIGAGAGAAVGVLGVLLTRGNPSIIDPEQALTFRIEAPLTISTDRAPQAFRYVQPNEYNRPVYSQAPAPSYAPAPPPYAPAPYHAAAYPVPYYGGYYGYPYYSPYYYHPSFTLLFGSGYYGRPGFYGRPYYYGHPGGYVPRHR